MICISNAICRRIERLVLLSVVAVLYAPNARVTLTGTHVPPAEFDGSSGRHDRTAPLRLSAYCQGEPFSPHDQSEPISHQLPMGHG